MRQTPTIAKVIGKALTALSLALLSTDARAVELSSGRVTLPLSGLVVDLPLPTGSGTYEVTSLYRLIESSSYSAIDTIRRRDASKKTLETYYVRHGKLKSDCTAFLDSDFPGLARPGSMHGVSGTIAASPGKREVAFCTTPRSESVVITLWLPDRAASSLSPAPDQSALSEAQLVSALSDSPIAAAVLAAATARRVEVLAPLGRSDVTATSSSRPYPAPIRLPKLAIDLPLPSDGFVWVHDAEASKGRIGDHLATVFPSATDLAITVVLMGRGDCGSVWKREGGTVTGEARVAGFSGALFTSSDGLRHEAHLCRAKADRLIIAQLGALAPLGELERFAPILTAIDQTLSRLPAPPPGRVAGAPPSTSGHPGSSSTTGRPPATTVAPPRPPPTYRPEPTDGFLFMQFGSELIVSSRDTGGRDEDVFPATRVTGPGLAMDFVFKADGFISRTAFAATYDLGGIFSGDATSSARWGASHLEAAFEFGYAAGSDFILGFMAGWTGMSGPLTLNSSLSVSAIVGMAPESLGEFGWLLRATPIQLFAANERELMSPFELELHLSPAEGLGVTLGFQWIGAPEPGDEDIPAEGWALSLSVGSGVFAEP